jgi:hypothetical protein
VLTQLIQGSHPSLLNELSLWHALAQSACLTIRAGGFAVVRLQFAWGGPDPYATMQTVLDKLQNVFSAGGAFAFPGLPADNVPLVLRLRFGGERPARK